MSFIKMSSFKRVVTITGEEYLVALNNKNIKIRITDLREYFQIGVNVAFKGVASPGDNPGVQTTPAFWLTTEPGTYTNFGGVVVSSTSKFAIISWNGSAYEVSEASISLKEFYDISIIGKQRKRKWLAYDAALKRIVVVGSDTTPVSSGGDQQVFNINIDGVELIVNGVAGAVRDFSSVTLEGNMAFVFNKSLGTAQLSDVQLIPASSVTDAHVKIGHLTYGAGLTSRWIIDYGLWIERKNAYDNSVKLLNDFSNLKFTRRMSKYITYDKATKKLQIVGSNAAAPGDDQVYSLEYNGEHYEIHGSVGESVILSDLGAAHAQIGFSSLVADKLNVQLSDMVVYNSNDPVLNFVKIAHVVYNDGLTSDIVQDARTFVLNQSDINKSLANNFVYNSKYLWRKRKWLAYDRATMRLIVVGSDAAQPSDEQLLNFVHDGINYTLKGFVGATKQFSGISGNTQFFIPKTVTPSNVNISDIVIFVDPDNRDATHIKIGHITYNDGLTSDFIIDYADYVENQTAIKSINPAFSFVNNSAGETNFANGVQSKLKILGYGNSFMRNSVAYLSAIASGADVDVTVGNLYTGGTNLLDHLYALQNGTAPYLWYKYEEGINTEFLYNQQADYGLHSERWDAIILHQYTPWTQPFEPYLSELIKLIVKKLGYCPKFYLNSTWAGHEDFVEEQYGFGTEIEMWDYMLDSTKQACLDAGINENSLIPTGTAIQNARTLPYADTFLRFVNGNPDWHHLNCAGGFIAACAIYEKIIYPLNKIHCSETTFRLPAGADMPPESGITNPGVVVNDSNYLSMCEAVIDAIANPYVVTNQ